MDHMTTTALAPSAQHDEEVAQLATLLPPIPVETHAVGVALALAAAKDGISLAQFLMEFSARDHAAVWNALVTAQTNLIAAFEHYRTFGEVVECRGQA
jgi:hypothetical protein